VAVHRYGVHRARTRAETDWAGRLFDALQQAVDEARR
jgi:hypothetical protein